MNAVTKNPNVQGGIPCFTGTRVPAVSLFDYLEGGYSVDAFIEQFPSVKREQVFHVLEESKRHIESIASTIGTS
jgi:uncharacterized protein (DUF433 family)